MRKLFAASLLALAVQATPAFAASETAVFAGGCFWCVESDFDKVKGVTATISGYAGGTMAKPTYEDHEGNQEAVKIEYDPAIVSYETLVAYFLRTIDVTDDGGQFCDRGSSYTSAIFAKGPEQLAAATKAVKDARAALGQDIVTPVKPFTTFADAEDYHQNYHLGENRVLSRFGWVKQSEAYEGYRKGCGRDARVEAVWGKQAHMLGTGS